VCVADGRDQCRASDDGQKARRPPALTRAPAAASVARIPFEGGGSMQRLTTTLMALATLALPAFGSAATWQLDPAHSSVQFSIRHMMISNVRGEFRTFSATATGDPLKPAEASVKATIDAASIDTGDEKRDAHLKNPDFLDVGKYPTITFESTKIEPAGDTGVKVTGNLTLHGVTKEVVLDVEGPVTVKDPQGNLKAGAHATTKINRQDFGITWSKALDGGGLMVGDEVTITIDLEGVQTAP
jgi:polyisoprenoid-binding protein YceI